MGQINKNKNKDHPSSKNSSKGVISNIPLNINEKAELKKMIMKLSP